MIIYLIVLLMSYIMYIYFFFNKFIYTVCTFICVLENGVCLCYLTWLLRPENPITFLNMSLMCCVSLPSILSNIMQESSRKFQCTYLKLPQQERALFLVTLKDLSKYPDRQGYIQQGGSRHGQKLQVISSAPVFRLHAREKQSKIYYGILY